MSLYTF